MRRILLTLGPACILVGGLITDAQSGGTCPDGREIVLARVGYRCAETSKLEMPR